jgi:hypothetical protein
MTWKKTFQYLGTGLLACISFSGCDFVSLDSIDPDMGIAMDATEFDRNLIAGTAVISFLIENRGTGSAYLEGCPDPVHMVIQRWESNDWTDHMTLNESCVSGADPVQVRLDGNKAYSYDYQESAPGHYRFTVFYGKELDEPAEYTVVSPEYDVN